MGTQFCGMAGAGGCTVSVASRCFRFPFLCSWKAGVTAGWGGLSLGSLVLTGANWKPWKPFWRRVQSMAGAGQRAGPPVTHTSPSPQVTGRPRWWVLAPVPGAGWLCGGVSYPQGRSGGSGWGSRAGAGALPCSSQAASPQPSPRAQAAAPHWVPLVELGSHRGWGRASWGQGASRVAPLPQPLSPSPRKQRGAAVWGDLHPSVPFTPRVCVGTPGLRRWDRGTLFYALKPRYPQPWAALGRDLSSSRQHQAPARAVLPCSAWGARLCMGLRGQPWVPLPAPGLGHPREAKPSTPVPAAAPAWQHLPSRTMVKG